MTVSRDERIQVLEMVAAGRVTPEEGNQLLEALGSDAAPRRDGQGSRGARGDDRRRPGSHRSHADIDMLRDARIHGVTPQYVQEIREAGFSDLSLQQLIELRMYGVNAEFIREMREMGLTDLGVRELAELSMHGVTPSFIREMRAMGFGDLSVHQAIDLRTQGIEPEDVPEEEAAEPDDFDEASR